MVPSSKAVEDLEEQDCCPSRVGFERRYLSSSLNLEFGDGGVWAGLSTQPTGGGVSRIVAAFRDGFTERQSKPWMSCSPYRRNCWGPLSPPASVRRLLVREWTTTSGSGPGQGPSSVCDRLQQRSSIVHVDQLLGSRPQGLG